MRAAGTDVLPYIGLVRGSGSEVAFSGTSQIVVRQEGVSFANIDLGLSAGRLTGEGVMEFGEENADEMRMKNGEVEFQSNNAGGVLGGISTGQDLVVRFAVKATSSILTPRQTVTRQGENTEIATKGRHDPCVGIRGVPVGEAMMACVLADHLLRHRGQTG